ncbi:MAG: 50S ribosomal protein L9 [candidate division TM6 bacterium GW2011_GWF2_32_72]|nr:MAG: 50S ribosomal protein L9 [candidate division TM6 bacterium GW2011_GWF2_32_72]
MKIFLLKDIERLGLAGEIIKASDGYAQNYLIPRKLGVELTEKNEAFYKSKVRQVEHRKEVIASKTSILAEKIKQLKVVLKKKLHDDDKLYAAVRSSEVVDLLAANGVNVSKDQIVFTKSIKTKGSHPVTVKLSSKLTPEFTLVIVSE